VHAGLARDGRFRVFSVDYELAAAVELEASSSNEALEIVADAYRDALTAVLGREPPHLGYEARPV
jgi:hypothetical protein